MLCREAALNSQHGRRSVPPNLAVPILYRKGTPWQCLESHLAMQERSGEVVGIIDQSISDNSSKRLVTGYGISGLKSEIELLSNGQAVPYVGIRGLDVTAEIEAQGIPNGVYVQTVEPDSPAMAAGIQSGDIITEAAGKKISSLAVYQSVMRDQKSDSKIRLKGQRQGSGGYVDISFDVTVGSKE